MTESDNLKETLASTRLCKNLSAHDIDNLIKHNTLCQFKSGHVLVQQGKKSLGLYVILEGKVTMMAKILGEGMTDITKLERGDIVGESCVLEDVASATSAFADTPVKCLLISNAYFEMLTMFYPKLRFKLIKSISDEICHHLQALHKKISQYMQQSHMATQSLFGKVMKTLTHHSVAIPLTEIGIPLDEIRQAAIFKNFNEDEFAELIKSMLVIKTPKQCPLIVKHEKSLDCYIVIRGAVQSSIVENDMIAKLSVLRPMKLFCNLSFMDCMETNSINYAACERAILFKIPEEYLLSLPKRNPELWYKLFDLICQSFAELERAAKKLDVRLNSEIYNRQINNV